MLNEKFHFLIPDPVDSEVHVFCSLTKNVNKSVNAFQNLVDQLDCELVPCTRQIWELTASYYAKYLKNRDIEKIQCSKCGFQAVYLCTQCSFRLTTRQHLLTDFIIGAFAEIDPEKTLLTLDQVYLKLISLN